MLKYVEGDLFQGIDTMDRPIVIAHVVNTHGAFGAGFVVPLGRRFPKAKESYLQWAKDKSWNDVPFLLGKVQIVEVEHLVYVANLAAQTLGGHRPLFYNHLARCMDTVAEFATEIKAHIAAPMFGSGLAGGKHQIIEALVIDCWVRRGIPVTMFYLPNQLPDDWSPPYINQE